MSFFTPPRLILSFGLYCLLAFAVVAVGVFQGREIVQFDEVQAERVYRFAQTHPAVGEFFAVVTDFGSSRPLHILVVGIVIALILRRQYLLALLVFVTPILNHELNVWLKQLFTRIRPVSADASVWAGSWSFPSGHAQSSMFIYGLSIYLGFLAFPRWKWWLGSGLMLLIVLIGFSRMVLGVHYFTDVLCGFLMGMAHLSIWIALIEHRRSTNRSSVAN